ncbi:multidrug resistance protein [Vibrio inusitatus NBRC 102082]|uniref:Multidrug resistance protein n=1 Tax=Vibrio inusitatus NBRC 102082 TaxID=1219070 RepID=A0A4Y3HRW3_9VIBR|nr:efflux RND transporter permease subunit [Vibrio inusitatus]GEA49681.1 multidrug resistance protein [Vibrio inusitatus NBRC 102082]
MRSPIAWMAKDKVTPNLLMLMLIFGGLLVSWNIKKEITPAFDLDEVIVDVEYSGAAPDEIDLSVVLPIENAIRSLEGIDELTSTSKSGKASVSMTVIDGFDVNYLLQEVEQAINRLSTLPLEAEKPRVYIKSRKKDVMEIVLHGNVDKRALHTLTEDVRQRLLQESGITQIDLEQDLDHEIQVNVDHQQLQKLNLTLNDISNAIKTHAFDFGAGEIETVSGDISVRVHGRLETAQDFVAIPVKSTQSGSTVRLGSVATVEDGLNDDDHQMRYNGEPASGLTVYRVGQQTPVGVSQAVRDVLPEIETNLPPGVSIVIADDDSINYYNQMSILLKNAFLGLVLVLVMLSIFLEYRLAFWVTMGIPTSFLGAMLLLPGMDVSINTVSMFAFIMALGIVVDDSIVAGENIYHRRQQGMSFMKAAILGAKDVAVPLTFSILTNMVAFLPILTLPGQIGKLQAATPLVVISVFAISWVEALFILPAHLGRMKDKPKGEIGQKLDSWQGSVDRRLQHFIHQMYKPTLQSVINRKYLSLSVAIAVMVLVGAWLASGRLGFYLMPRFEVNGVRVVATMPYGTAESRMEEVAKLLEQSAERIVEQNGGEEFATGLTTSIKGTTLRVSLYLGDPSLRALSTRDIAKLWRAENSDITGVESMRYTTSGGGPGGGPALTVQMNHSNTQILREASQLLTSELHAFSGVSEISSSFSSGNSQLDVSISSVGLAMGLTADDISQQLRHAFFGATALKQQQGIHEVAVKVQLDEQYRQSELDLYNLMIQIPNGQYVPLSRVANVAHSVAPSEVTRRDGRRSVEVTADVADRSKTPQLVASLQQGIFTELEHRYPSLKISLGGQQKNAANSLSALSKSSLLALIVIYALLAIPFQSYTQPLLVMAAIPFSVVGAVLGHMILGHPLSIISILGVIALCGVVVNDSLMLITTYNRNRAKGETWREAIVNAATRRFRPIFLTTATTFCGLAPMIFETSKEGQLMIPMAISLGFGILFATVITLVIIPCMLGVGQDIKQWLSPLSTGAITNQRVCNE